MPDKDCKPVTRSEVRIAWSRWLLAFFPLATAAAAATYFLGFNVVLAALIVLLGAQLLRQRYVNGRSWNSILWGVYAKRNDR